MDWERFEKSRVELAEAAHEIAGQVDLVKERVPVRDFQIIRGEFTALEDELQRIQALSGPALQSAFGFSVKKAGDVVELMRKSDSKAPGDVAGTIKRIADGLETLKTELESPHRRRGLFSPVEG